jgi:NADH dehydrogenase [ubiquinone] 1 alpha subcomplex assembly factor 7
MIRFDKFIQKNNKKYYEKAFLQDFTTPSELSPIFSECLGAYFGNILINNNIKEITLAELGPGRGTFIHNISTIFKKLQIEHKIILFDQSIQIRKNKDLEGGVQYFSSFKDFLNNLPAQSLVFANEFFDALPIRVFKDSHELYYHQSNYFWQKSNNKNAQQGWYEHHESGIEILKEIAEKIKGEGSIFISDYGYEKGIGETLQFIKNGKFCSIGDFEIGEADITSHVPFGQFRRVLEEKGLQTFLEDQGKFLISIGAKERLEQIKTMSIDKEKIAKIVMGTERLLNPFSMGNLFKILIAY